MARYRTRKQTIHYWLGWAMALLLALSFGGGAYYAGWFDAWQIESLFACVMFFALLYVGIFFFTGISLFTAGSALQAEGLVGRIIFVLGLALCGGASFWLTAVIGAHFHWLDRDWQTVSWQLTLVFVVGTVVCVGIGVALFVNPVPQITDSRSSLYGKVLILATFPMVIMSVGNGILVSTALPAWEIAAVSTVVFFVALYFASSILFPERVDLRDWIDERINNLSGLYDPYGLIERIFWFCTKCRGSLYYTMCSNCGENKFVSHQGNLHCTKCGVAIGGLRCRCGLETALQLLGPVSHEKLSRQRRRLNGLIVMSAECYCPRCLQPVVYDRCLTCGNQAFRVLSNQATPELSCTSCKSRLSFLVCDNQLYNDQCECDIQLDFAAFRLPNGKYRWFRRGLRDAFDELTRIPHPQFLPGDIEPIISHEGKGRPRETSTTGYKV